MKNNKNKPLQIALFGMDDRAYKTMSMYLKGPCKGIAVVVNEFEAEIDIIDADHIKAKALLAERKNKGASRPILILSLEELSIEGTLYVKKPVSKEGLLTALNKAKEILKTERLKQEKKITEPEIKKEEVVVAEKKQAGIKHIDKEEKKKVSKHRTAMDLTEVGFSAYIGHVDGIDFSDRKQLLNASYNSKGFFLGYVQSALKVSKAKGRILQLNSGWKPLIIFPHSKEIWLDADDKQLRSFAGLAIKSNSSQGMTLTPVGQNSSNFNNKMEGFYDVDYFLWKLAIWTSKGRYPSTIDIKQPVFLKQWPNFTRLVVTPHAIQIAALLILAPRTALDIAKVLNIKPQYVFVFISAAHVLGLVGQAKRQADDIVLPSKEIKVAAKKGLLSRILGRLRG